MPDSISHRKLELDHQARQNTERENAVEGYRDHDLVFASEVGMVTEYYDLRRVLKTLIAQVILRGWQDAGLVEHTEPHTPARYNELLLEKPDLKAKAILSDLGLHGLRHTNTSVLIRRGLNAKVVSDRLGHTSVAFTLKKYAHLFDEQRREAAISMADFLGEDGDGLDDKGTKDANVTVLVPAAAD